MNIMDTKKYISQEELIGLVDTLCKESVNGAVDITHRTFETFCKYHEAIKEKYFVYKDIEMPFGNDRTINSSFILTIGHWVDLWSQNTMKRTRVCTL